MTLCGTLVGHARGACGEDSAQSCAPRTALSLRTGCAAAQQPHMDASTPEIALVGVGRMELPMLCSLIRSHGYPASKVRCFDISPRVSVLPEVQWCTDAATAIMLMTSPSVRM